MVSGDFCHHDWPGSGCDECRKEMRYMSTHDISGKEWARVDQVKRGSIVQTDGGSPCFRKNYNYVVHANQESGELYIKCRDGCHVLDGQYNEAETHYVGIYFVE